MGVLVKLADRMRTTFAPSEWERKWAGELAAMRRLYGDGLAQQMGERGFERMNVIPNIGFAQDLTEFAAEFKGGVSEVVRWTLYSFNTYATTGHTQLIFFSTPVAQATNGYGDTNMQQAGAMAGNEAFVITAIRVVPQPALADYQTAAAGTPIAFGQWNEVLQRNVWLELRIGDKLYMQAGPLILFPQGTGPGTVVAGAATVLANVSWMNNGSPDNKATYNVDPPLLILPTRTFSVTINWRTALAVTTAGKLGVWLDGYRVRTVQ